jgi:two-component system, NtrC family, sensor kinase
VDEPIKILCVDDEQNVLNALRRLFLDEDYEILVANSSEAGLQVLEKEHAQLVISDYRMPGTNGVEFLRKVCERWPETIRIVLSGYADVSAIVAAINEGQIYKFVPKPWNDTELKVTVSNALESYFLAEKNRALARELQDKNEKLARLNETLKKLLEDNTSSLAFKSYALNSYQNILDSIPVGIAGVDPDELVVMCNIAWATTMGGAWHCLGQSMRNCFPDHLIDFVEEVRNKEKFKRRLALNGVQGTLLGVIMESGEGQKGIILTFAPEGMIS